MRRGEIWWASLPEPVGSEPGFRRPVVIIQADEFNHSNISTVVCAAITSNLKLAAAQNSEAAYMKLFLIETQNPFADKLPVFSMTWSE